MENQFTDSQKLHKYDRIIELSTWVVIVLVIFGVRFLPQQLIDEDKAYVLIGGIASFALLYYLVIYKYFSRTNRVYLKEIADIVLIGVLIHLLKDYGQYFFALYFLPIAAAALSLQFMSALLIATIASLFVVFEIFLGSFDLLNQETTSVYQGISQIAFILLITIFCRFLAMQIKQEKTLKEEALAKQKALEEEAKKEKEFMSLTSHQLFTPLSIIRGFSSMLNDGKFGELNTKQQEAVGEVYKSTKRLVSLVSELQAVSKLQTKGIKLEKKPVNLKLLIESVAKEIECIKTNKDQVMTLDLPEKEHLINVDEEKIRQVLYNLLSNALKYTPEGSILIRVKDTPDDTLISVKDEGVGIPREDSEKVFQPFFRGKNILELDNKGTGLGLYIARLIIEAHSGKIWVESKENRGTTFSFSLPNNPKN